MVNKKSSAKKALRTRKAKKSVNKLKAVDCAGVLGKRGRKKRDGAGMRMAVVQKAPDDAAKATDVQKKCAKAGAVDPVLRSISMDKPLSNRDKIAILKNTRSLFANINSVCDCVELLYDPLLRRSLLAKVVDFMVETDVNIASEYDSLSDEEWSEIESMYPTPISNDKNKTLREQIQTFTNIFLKLDCFFKDVGIVGVFDIFEKYVFTSKTRYVQFLIYNMDPEDVLVYFLSSLKRNHALSGHYIAYFSSFLVRRKMEENLIAKAISCFFKYFKDLKSRFLYLNAAQYFLYILCFKQTYVNTYETFINTLFKNDVMYLNRNIVNVFCNVHSRKEVSGFIESDISRIDLFYFDPPNISRIMKVYESNFLTFDKSKI